jgi:hypothetical protein
VSWARGSGDDSSCSSTHQWAKAKAKAKAKVETTKRAKFRFPSPLLVLISGNGVNRGRFAVLYAMCSMQDLSLNHVNFYALMLPLA